MNIETNTKPLAHNFGGIDGRCFGCDVRPGSRAAQEPCDGW